MWITWLLIVYCVLIVASSVGGGVLPTLMKLTHTRMQLMMSYVGGLMLGVALLHMLPHALLVGSVSLDAVMLAMVAGLLAMFFLIRIFHVHQHEHDDMACAHQHHHDHAHLEHEHDGDQGERPERVDQERPSAVPDDGNRAAQLGIGWVGILTGFSLHTFIDGVALAASVAAESHGSTAFRWFGLGTFLAVCLHKPLDALSITWLMSAEGWSKQEAMIVNCVFALVCPLGALAFYFGAADYVDEHPALLGLALAFGAGVFLCISLADLLPEVQFHAHDRLKLSVWLLAGVATALAIRWIEPAHSHPHRLNHERKIEEDRPPAARPLGLGSWWMDVHALRHERETGVCFLTEAQRHGDGSVLTGSYMHGRHPTPCLCEGFLEASAAGPSAIPPPG